MEGCDQNPKKSYQKSIAKRNSFARTAIKKILRQVEGKGMLILINLLPRKF